MNLLYYSWVLAVHFIKRWLANEYQNLSTKMSPMVHHTYALWGDNVYLISHIRFSYPKYRINMLFDSGMWIYLTQKFHITLWYHVVWYSLIRYLSYSLSLCPTTYNVQCIPSTLSDSKLYTLNFSMGFNIRGRPLFIWGARGAKRKEKFVRKIKTKKLLRRVAEKKNCSGKSAPPPQVINGWPLISPYMDCVTHK